MGLKAFIFFLFSSSDVTKTLRFISDSLVCSLVPNSYIISCNHVFIQCIQSMEEGYSRNGMTMMGKKIIDCMIYILCSFIL